MSKELTKFLKNWKKKTFFLKTLRIEVETGFNVWAKCAWVLVSSYFVFCSATFEFASFPSLWLGPKFEGHRDNSNFYVDLPKEDGVGEQPT